MIIKKLDHLLKQGRKVYNEKVMTEANLYKEDTKFKDKIKYTIGFAKTSSDQHQFETNCILIENEFRKLVWTSNYSKRVEPLYYTCLFLSGGFFSLVFIIFLIHMFMAGTLKANQA